jgi:hypothetical protein
MSGPSLGFMLMLGAALPLHGQNLEPADVHVTLDSALHIAQRTAATAFPDLSNYLLYSIAPRVLLGDRGGLHWELRWQARDFPHRRGLVVRVYMKDGHTRAEREGEAQPPSPNDASPSR